MNKYYFLLTIISIICHSFQSIKAQKGNEKIKCYKLVSEVPSNNGEGNVEQYLKDSFYVYYYNDLAMYELPYQYQFTIPGYNINYNERRCLFLIYHKGSPSGLLVDTSNHKNNKWCNVDSLKQTRDFEMNSNLFYGIFPQSNYKLLSATTNDKEATLYETYRMIKKQDITLQSTVYLTYTTKYQDLDLSLSKHLDSIKMSKLISNRVVTDQRYVPAYKITIEKAEYSSSITKVNPPNKEVILRYFKLFQTVEDKKNNK